MALSVQPNQTYRLRDLRDNAVPRDRSEPRAPSRRPKFEDRLSDPRAGELVGEFPANFDEAPSRGRPKRNTLNEAQSRLRPRQAVAALMAREGISTFTQMGAALQKRQQDEAKQDNREWLRLLPEAKKAPAQNAEDKLLAERAERLDAKRAELRQLDRFSRSIDGYSALQKHLQGADSRVLKEAGRLEVSAGGTPASRDHANVEMLKREMAMDQQLNLHYLQLQDKLSRGLETLLSNLMKTRNETVKNAISGS